MNYVWFVNYCDGTDTNVVATAEMAYKYCRNWVRACGYHNYPAYDKKYADREQEILAELEADYSQYPEQFGVPEVCGAIRYEVEGEE